MSYTVPPAAADPRVRPGVVTAASYLLYATAVIQVINAILSLSTISAVRRVYDEVYAPYPEIHDTVVTVGPAVIIGAAVVNVLIAVGFIALGVLDSRGKNTARIVTWVLGGLAVCCLGSSVGFGAAGAANFGAGSGGNNTNAPDAAEVARVLDRELPSWYSPATTLLSLLAVLALLAVIILLLLPPSNAYFRKLQPTLAAPGYPIDPAYPAYPSYPTHPGGDQPPPGGMPPAGGMPPGGMPPGGGAPPADPNAR